MATYDRATYSLRFTVDYKEIEVVNGSNVVTATYDLQASSQSVSVSVEGDDYVVSYGSDFGTPKNTIDVTGGATMAFDGTTMGGIGIVDLRDMRDGGSFLANYTYHLDCTAFKMKYVSGSFALQILFSNTTCLEWEEVEE